MTTLKQITDELKIDSKKARRILRKEFGSQKKRYTYSTKTEVNKIKKLLAA